ncbi:hypothetical protein ACOME3_008084 [Neoechinorhynchus agilis]
MAPKKKKIRPTEKGIINRHFHSMNPYRLHKDGSATKPGMRTRSTIKRLQVYRNSKPIRDAKGKIVKDAPFQARLPSGSVARVVPDRRWFGNTRLIAQDTLQEFREKMKTADESPYEIVLKRAKLPTSLLTQPCKAKKMSLLDVESFQDTFGKKCQRKRPKLCDQVDDLQQLALTAQKSLEKYEQKHDEDEIEDSGDMIGDAQVGIEQSHPIFKAGTSKRIWAELYKVIDSSDVLIEVLDARDPVGTRCTEVEAYIKKNKQHKHIVLVVNKCDLVPHASAKLWHRHLAKEYPTVMFKACVQNPYGRYELAQDVLGKQCE